MAWIGRKKLAFIPLSRTGIQPADVIPSDWPGQIMQRLFFDPVATSNPIPGTRHSACVSDRSVRAYFHTVSSDPVVVGFGGWQEFKFLFGGRNLSGEDRIYAVVV